MSRFFFCSVLSGMLVVIVGGAIQLAIIPFFLTNVGAELTGVYVLLMAVAHYVALGIGWLGGVGIQMMVRQSSQSSNFSGRDVYRLLLLGYLLYSLMLYGVLVLGSVSVGDLWLTSLNVEQCRQVSRACIALGAYLTVVYLHSADTAVLTGLLEQTRVNTYRLLSQCLFATCTLLLVPLLGTIDAVFIAMAIGNLPSLILGRWRVSKRLGSPFLDSPALHRKLHLAFHASSPRGFFAFDVVQLSLSYFDAFLVGLLLGPAAVASYTVLSKIADFLTLLATRASDMLIPHLALAQASSKEPRMERLYLSSTRLQLYVGSTIMLVYGSLGPDIVRLWVGSNAPVVDNWVYWVAGATVFFRVACRQPIVLAYARGVLRPAVVLLLLEFVSRLLAVTLLAESLFEAAPLVATVLFHALGGAVAYQLLARVTGCSTQGLRGLLLLGSLLFSAGIALSVVLSCYTFPHITFWKVYLTILAKSSVLVTVIGLVYLMDPGLRKTMREFLETIRESFTARKQHDGVSALE